VRRQVDKSTRFGPHLSVGGGQRGTTMKIARLTYAAFGLVLVFAVAVRASAGGSPASPLGGSSPGSAATAVDPVAGQNSPGSQVQLSAPFSSLKSPRVATSKTKRAKYERRTGAGNVLVNQWSPIDKSLPLELQPNSGYLQQRDHSTAGLSLKEAIYIAIRNNPGMKAEMLEPLATEESVRQANAAFDPLMRADLSETKDVVPAITNFGTVGTPAFERKEYDWNFEITKLSSLTNGSLSINFDNNRYQSNARTWTVNPSYNPSLGISLTQPLLRNFGFDFATINVRLAELGQKQSQYNLEQHLSDFVLQVGAEYWNVVRAEENFRVATGALKLAQDLLNQNLVSLRLGMVAQIDVQEAQAETESWQATLFAANNTLAIARAVLRQDVMLTPSHAYLPKQIEPSDTPIGADNLKLDDERSMEAAVECRPELAAMREAIRSMLLQVRFAENQTLPKLDIGARFGINSTAGSANCFHFHDVGAPNCIVSGRTTTGSTLPLRGIYGDALNQLWNFSYYDYAVGFNLEVPLSNDYANSALAQARVQADEQRLRYREQISQIVVQVETALSNLRTSAERVHATNAATDYARAALSAEEARYRGGVSDTHELLQYQQELIAELGNQVRAQLDLETAKLSLKHAEGTLLRIFQINFALDNPRRSPWYSRFRYLK